MLRLNAVPAALRPLAAAIALLLVLGVLRAVQERPAPARPAPYLSTSFAPDGYAAFARLLARENLQVQRFRLRSLELDAAVGTLVAAAPAEPASAHADGDASVAAWLRDGGRLVQAGASPAASGLVVRIVHASFGPLRGPWAATVGRIDGLAPDVRLGVPARGAIIELADGAGPIVARVADGRGRVIALADPHVLDNAHIGHGGNARLALLLAQAGGAERVTFDDALRGDVVDRPWYRALSPPQATGLGFAFAIVLLGLIGSALRPGAPVTAEPPREPDSREFVAALAALQQRTGGRERTARTLTADALHAVARAAAVPDDTPPQRLAACFDGERATRIRALAERHAGVIATDDDLLSAATLAAAVRRECTDDAARDGRRPAARRRTGASRRR